MFTFIRQNVCIICIGFTMLQILPIVEPTISCKKKVKIIDHSVTSVNTSLAV